MKNLFEVVKSNKKNIVRGALLVGGTIVAAVLTNATLRSDEVEYEVFDEEEESEDTVEVEVESSEE